MECTLESSNGVTGTSTRTGSSRGRGAAELYLLEQACLGYQGRGYTYLVIRLLSYTGSCPPVPCAPASSSLRSVPLPSAAQLRSAPPNYYCVLVLGPQSPL